MTSSKTQYHVSLRGDAILTSSRWNKGTAFSMAERKAFGLTGRLPNRVNTLDEQCERAYDQLQARDSPIRKNCYLQSLKNQNWVLYFALLSRHVRELVPIIYTPTEADAIASYSRLFRRSEGLYLTLPDQDTMEQDFLEQVKGRSIDLIVCSDAEQILGIGDQGVGISAAKAVIYTLIGGIDPSRGWSNKRIRGEQYDQFIDKFLQFVRKYLPHCLVHFEDFGVTNAQRILARYRDTHPAPAQSLSCVMSAIGVTKTKLSDQRFIVYGAGSAGLGITKQLRDAMVATDGIPEEEADTKFWLIDKHGLIRQSTPDVREDLRAFIRSDEEWSSFTGKVGLLDVVKQVKPTVLIGCSTHAGGFTEEVVKTMAAHCERPIILPLSNPCRLVEVNPSDANEWTRGKALLATGSPFPPAKMPNGKDLYTMIIAGARRLAELSPALKDPDNALLPDFEDAPQVNFEVAVARGSAGVDWSKEEVRAKAKAQLWEPVYAEYVYDKHGEA
ncbi:hypothetical protein EV421DRAFT_1799619 [Armillaria borealis]|uniref:Malic enzyme n=1 Tax=Armillaria borealis TaxID=47425 RepID=A0AA39JL64_9AGAR|nr:hypothetical protein EV421DRAFT_1799619 [Armillaria borealis]